MIDIICNEINIGDKISFIPPQKWRPQKLHYGIVVKMTNDGGACYCKSLNSCNDSVILRHSHQIIKLN